MNFNQHYELIGKHAFLSASKWNWLNYDEDHLRGAFERAMAKEHGTKLHDLAKQCIDLKVKLPQSRKTLNSYVNDAIKYRMKTEQILYYSRNCFGTADAISFKNKLLRIHDLKNRSDPGAYGAADDLCRLVLSRVPYQTCQDDDRAENLPVRRYFGVQSRSRRYRFGYGKDRRLRYFAEPH